MMAPNAWRVALVALAATSACARPSPHAPRAPARDVVVLAEDPETGAVGRVRVGNPEGQVELGERGASTRIVAGRAPEAPTVMSEADVQQLFGSALAVRPPAARRFDLYFVTGSDALTPESRGRVPEVLAAVLNRVAPDVSVVGHTDTTGSAASNAELGRRRAAVLRDLLVQAGLDRSLVETTSHGETDLLVATPDNTAEARNRRVEVIVR